MVVAILLALSAGAARAPAQRQPTLHLLAVGDTLDRKIGKAAQADLDNIEGVFKSNVPGSQLRVRKLSGSRVARNEILAAIGALTVQAGDTVVLYFSTHGAFDPTRSDHWLSTRSQALSCRSLQAAASRLRPKGAVILTDACSDLMRMPPSVAGFPPSPDRVSPLFESLFFDRRGILHISSSRPGESARCDSNGSFFTSALCGFLTAEAERRLSWSTVLREVNQAVRDRHPGARQTAYVASETSTENAGIPVGEDAPPESTQSVRFGATAQATARSAPLNGVEVTYVVPGHPAESLRRNGATYRLIPGWHVITHVNGQPVTTYDEYVDAVRRSPREMSLRVYNLNWGTHHNYEATLRD